MDKISCIVPIFFPDHEPSKKYRISNIINFLKWIHRYKDIIDEIVVCEQYLNQPSNLNIFKSYDNIKYVTIQKNFESIYYGWLMNYASKFSKNDNLLFSDCDGIYEIEKCFSIIDDYDCVSPFNGIYYSNEKETSDFIQHMNIKIFNQMIMNQYISMNRYLKINYVGGASFFIKKKNFFDIAGFDESVISWGPAGEMIGLKIKHFLKSKIMNQCLFHMYHIPEPNYGCDHIKKKYIGYSEVIFNSMKNMTKDELQEKINIDKEYMGVL